MGILHMLNDSLADVMISQETRVLYGRDWFEERLLGLSFVVSSFSFFQPNSGAAALLYARVADYVSSALQEQGGAEGRLIYDLYSGTGTITQLLARMAGEAVGVEIVEEAVKAARENAQRNGIQNVSFLCGDVLKELDNLTRKPDVIVLDPPRDGIHPKALPKILSYGVRDVVYVSCKATSLVRDLPMFLEQGYQVKRACCVDQFAQTPHVETIVLMSKNTS